MSSCPGIYRKNVVLGDVIQLDGVWWLWDPTNGLLKYFQTSAALFFKQNANAFCGRMQAELPGSSSCQVSLLRPDLQEGSPTYAIRGWPLPLTQSFSQNSNCGRWRGFLQLSGPRPERNPTAMSGNTVHGGRSGTARVFLWKSLTGMKFGLSFIRTSCSNSPFPVT